MRSKVDAAAENADLCPADVEIYKADHLLNFDILSLSLDTQNTSFSIHQVSNSSSRSPQSSNSPFSSIMSEPHNTLGNGEWLLAGTSLWSNDGSVEFKMQGDGKIAIYWGGICQWQNTTQQKPNVKGIRMQGDGNLCMYDNNDTPIWHTDTARPTGDSTCIVAVQDDGNVVVYKGTPIWSSNTQKK